MGILKSIKRIFQTAEEKRHSLVGAAHLWKMKRDFQVNFLKEKGLLPSHKLLDIGCGTLRGGIPLIKYLDSGNYYGIEVRDSVLNEGKRELEEANLASKNPHLVVFTDFDTLELNAKFDFVFGFSVLIHMEDEIVKKCFSYVGKNLTDTGVFYANVNLNSRSEGNWQGFPVVYKTEAFYKDLASANNLVVSNLGELKDLGHISGQDMADKQIMLEFKKGVS